MANLSVNKGSIDPNSPLASLYASDYDFDNLQYPSNLGETNRGHWINFYINVHNRTKYAKSYTMVGGAGTAQALQDSNKSNYVTSGTIEPLKIGDIKITPNLTLGRQTKRIKQAIALFMPDTVNVNYAAEWQSSSLTDSLGIAGGIAQLGLSGADMAKGANGLSGAAKTMASNPAVQAEIASKAAEAFGSKIGLGSDAGAIMMHAAGTALNPQLEVIFKGVGLRTFQFDFLFAPKNAQEAKCVQNIITQFKFHMAPEIDSIGKGRYLIPPSEFDIDFIKDGKINDNVHKVSTCILQSMNIDYAPNGWSTFEDGKPVQTRMVLQFEETEIITKERAVQGY